MLSDVNQDSVVGALLDGRYRIIKELGHGGMGNVYLAEETRLRRRCAIKVLHPQLAQDRNHVERFLREAQMIAQLEHANIVDIYAYGEEPSGVVWFAMELLTGEDLDARLRARADRPFGTHEACVWAIQIARAVAVVHEAGLIHRDLKTSNVFLAQRRDGEELVKLLDFGIARPEEGSELTATGVALGTPSYMSPEQVRNAVVDRRSDIYSFGVLLFKLLTDRLPFQGEPIQVAMAHCLSPVPVPSSVAGESDISPELDAVILRSMAKEPGDRYQSMREVEAALIAVLQAEAPDLAPQARPVRMPTQSQVGRRSDAEAKPARPVTLPPPVGPTADARTPLTTHATGPTTQMAVDGQTSRHRLLYITIAASVLGIAVLLAVAMMGGRGESPAPIASQEPRSDGSSATRPPPGDAQVAAAKPTPMPEPPPPAVPPTPEPDPAPPEAPETTPADAQPGEAVAAPEKPKPRPAAAPVDPVKQIERKAQACRRKLKLLNGPTITVDYAIGMDGKVTRAIPSVKDTLGFCLSAAVQATQFPPKIVLGRKIVL